MKSSSHRILIIDDDIMLSGALSEYLKEYDFETVVKNTGHDGIDYVRNNRVDLVLLDINLPDISGFEVAKELKLLTSDNECCFLPVVLVSALSGEQDIVSGLTYADEYIRKPFSYEELVARVKAMLRICTLQKELKVSKEKFQNLYEEQKTVKRKVYNSARLASIGSLASGVAHEMNNPLAAILGFSDAVLSRIEQDGKVNLDELHEYMTIIKSETLRCRDVVANLSSFAGEMRGKFEEVSVREVVHSSLSMIKSKASKKKIKLSSDIDDTIVSSDKQKLGQVLLNIYTNSLAFCSAGDTINVTGEMVNDVYNLYIKDSGVGIPNEIMPHIFDPFFSTKEVGEGMGVGLTLCHMMMQELGGNITVTSNVGVGTTVHLELPI